MMMLMPSKQLQLRSDIPPSRPAKSWMDLEVSITWAHPGLFIPPFLEVGDGAQGRCTVCVTDLCGQSREPLGQGDSGHSMHRQCQSVTLCGAFLGMNDFVIDE